MTITTDKKNMHTTYGIIWKILNTLDLALDLENGIIPEEQFNAEVFKISETRFLNYLIMLNEAGYIQNLKVNEFLTEIRIDYSQVKITLAGIQFLVENSTMKKIADIAEKIGMRVAENGGAFLFEKLNH